MSHDEGTIDEPPLPASMDMEKDKSLLLAESSGAKAQTPKEGKSISKDVRSSTSVNETSFTVKEETKLRKGETYIEGYEETFKENGKHCDNNLKEFPRCSIESCNRSAHENSKYCYKHGGRRCIVDGCERLARGKLKKCIRHGGGKTCIVEGCTKLARDKTQKCISHGGGRRCVHPGCGKSALGPLMMCKSHGGGRRCCFENCGKTTAQGSTRYCTSHGAGKRCIVEGCVKLARGKVRKCIRHGGGKMCMVDGCTKLARDRTQKCIAHGGGRRCDVEGCEKGAAGPTNKCKAHGGGRRCTIEGCTKPSAKKQKLCSKHADMRLKPPEVAVEAKEVSKTERTNTEEISESSAVISKKKENNIQLEESVGDEVEAHIGKKQSNPAGGDSYGAKTRGIDASI